MKKILLILALNLGVFVSNSQIIFEKTFGGSAGEKGVSALEKSEGGYIIAGQTDSLNSGGAGIIVLSTNENGTMLWSKSYSSTNNDFVTSIKACDNGGYIITGYSSTINNDYDAFLLRIDASGNKLWSKSYGGPADDKSMSVVQNSNMEFIMAGSTTSYGAGSSDVYIVATDSTGNLLWSKTYGGSNDDAANSIELSSDNNYFITGKTSSFGNNTDAYVILADGNGDKIWTKAIGNTNIDYASAGRYTSDGGFIFTGTSYSWGSQTGDIYVVKLDNLGNVSWTKVLGTYEADMGNSITESADGSYVVAGTTFTLGAVGSAYMVKVSSTGSNQWARVYNNSSTNSNSVFCTQDQGFLITGEISSGNTDTDVYLVKTNESGKTSCNNESLPVLAFDFIPVSVSMTPADSGLSVSSNTNSGLSIAVCQAYGATTLCFENPATVAGVYVHPDVSVLDSIVAAPADEDIYREMNPFNTTAEFNVFPNPASGENINISINNAAGQELLVVVYDAMGKESFSKVIITGDDTNAVYSIDPAGKLAPGIYLVTATSEDNKFFKRLIVK
jgi:hypothetical protein